MERLWSTRLLQTFLVISILCLMVGEFLYLKEFGNTAIDYNQFTPQCLFCNELKGPVPQGLILMGIGLTLFIFIPIIRLITYAITYSRQKQLRYQWLTIVLILLTMAGYLHHFRI